MTTFTTQDRQNAQRTPLTDEEIVDMYFVSNLLPQPHDAIIKFARAIERAHGIGE